MSMSACGLAELIKKGLQVDAYSPIFKIDSKSGVLVLSGMSLFPRRHNYDVVVANNIFTAKGFTGKLHCTSNTQV